MFIEKIYEMVLSYFAGRYIVNPENIDPEFDLAVWNEQNQNAMCSLFYMKICWEKCRWVRRITTFLGAAVLLDEDGEGRVTLQPVGHAHHGAVDHVVVREDCLQSWFVLSAFYCLVRDFDH